MAMFVANTVTPIALTEISEAEAMAVGTLLDKIWPHEDRGPEDRARKLIELGGAYSGPGELGPRSLVVYQDEAVVAHALVFERVISLGGEEQGVLALAGVASDPELRGQGLGAAVVRAAFDLVDHGPFGMSLFQTSFPVQPFYKRLGACRVENRVFNSLSEEDPQANPFWDDLVMRYPAEGPWRSDDIDLKGPGY